jgi:hypothetical protein
LFSNVTTTMQIYSVKVAEIQIQDLQWPLEVYGVVAARDAVDYRRNLLFLRTRDDCQILTEEVCTRWFVCFSLGASVSLLKS